MKLPIIALIHSILTFTVIAQQEIKEDYKKVPEKIVSKLKAKKVSNNIKPVIIETQVQGSQEQPNVIYITPWQEVKTLVKIEDKKMSIFLPKFEPINPKHFKKKVHAYYQSQTIKERK